MAKDDKLDHEHHEDEPNRKPADREDDEKRAGQPNPPYTTRKGVTAPKFGSAGSGGLENEPGPERD